MADKRLTLDDLVGELRSGMTIGIGGWGSRRKPMAAVRAILRSDLTDLTVVSYGGPDVGLLCAAGKVAKVVFGFVTLDSIPTDPHFKAARQTGAVEAMEIDEGMFYLGLLAASQRLPFLPTRAGLGSDVLAVNPSLRTVVSPYDDGEELVADARPPARRRRRPREPGRRRRVRARSSGPTPSSTSCSSAPPSAGSSPPSGSSTPSSSPSEGPLQTHVHQPAADRRRDRDPRRGPLHRLRARLRPGRGVPAGVRGGRRRPRRVGGLQRRATSRSTRPATRRPPAGRGRAGRGHEPPGGA